MSQLTLPSLFASGGANSDVSMTLVEFSWIDYVVIIVYLVGIVALGCWAGMRKKREAKGADYFLAGKSLRWPLIGLALFATNISTIHLVSFAENGYTSGLIYGNFEWMAGFTLVILSLFFAPFYIRAGVSTLPDFLERRYSRGSRDFLAVLCVFSAVVVHIGFSLFTGAIVIERSLLTHFIDGDPEQYRMWVVVAICGATAAYTIVGGLMAVVLTESIQTVVLIGGSVLITILGLNMIGGWEALKASVHPANLSMVRPDSDPTALPWYAVFTGYWITGIWYWCTDQTIVQRVLGAKSETDARIGPLFAGFIKILPVFIFVLPGVICLGLINSETIPGLPELPDGSPDGKAAYSHMIQYILPVGCRGIIIAALLAALMSTVSGALNSIATLVSYDIYKRWSPDADDRHLIRVGRIVTFFAMLVAIAWTMGISLFKDKPIFQYMVDSFPVVAPPTTVVFVWGVFWKRASAKAALITLITGALLGLGVFIASINGLNKFGDYEVNALLSCFILAVIESVLLVVCSYIFPHKHTAESEKLVWSTPWDALRGKWKGIMDFRLWAGGLVVTMVGFYVWFAGDENYYVVQGTITLADGKTPVRGARVFFVCDDERFNFEDVTDAQGTYRYATPRLAGGAPEGTKYRVRLVPDSDLIVQMKEDEETKQQVPDKILYRVPVGTKIEETKAEDGSQVFTFEIEKTVKRVDEETGRLVSETKTVTKEITVAEGKVAKIFSATPIPENYTAAETSPLEITVEAIPMFAREQTRYNLSLE